MSLKHTCLCCLSRPPDKNLKTPYNRCGKAEVYADMLKECFEIHLSPLMGTDEDHGICEPCVLRLTDASDFKKQVQQCQKDFHKIVHDVKDESKLSIKQELADCEEANGIYFLNLKEELSDYGDVHSDEEDDKKLAELLLNDLAANGNKKKIERKKGEKKLKKKSSKPIKISIHALTQLDKIIHPPQVHMRRVTETIKHKINVENIIKYSNCTPFYNKTLSGITCLYCKSAYGNPIELRNHIDQSHKDCEITDSKKMDRNNLAYKIDITDLKCNICQAKFDFLSTLKQHLIKEHDIKFYSDVNDYVLEFKLTDSDSDVLNCALCNSKFETFKMLLQHMNGHYRNYICDVCDLGFINKHRLRNHQRIHEVGSFKCNFCEKIFTTKIRKMCHEKYTHKSTARYTTTCPHCDKSFNSYYQRNRHMYTDHNTVAASYKCNICDKSFILKAKLTAHIKKIHLMERNHICSVCGQGFFIKQSLEEHMVRHNGARIYKCTVCLKSYARKKTLREHMRIHNNDRRFKCSICGTSFVQKCSMKSHILSNHGLTLSEYDNNVQDLQTNNIID